MGILAGTTITVTFDAQQIAQLDCILQDAYMHLYPDSMPEYKERTQERVTNVFRALHAAGYR